MNTGKVYTHAVGVKLDLFIRDSLPEGCTVLVQICKPDGTVLERTGTLLSTTRVQYITQADELDLPGCYRVQPILVYAGVSIPGDTVHFEVFARFK